MGYGEKRVAQKARRTGNKSGFKKGYGGRWVGRLGEKA